MDKLVAMRNFVKITESTSLSAAARTLAMSLPVVSRGLAELERGLGVRLFTRTTRSLALTDEGETYRQHCLRILADIDNAESALAQIRATPKGRVTVSAPLLFGRLRVAPLLPAFLARYPDVSVDLLLVDRVVNLIDEGIDVAVRIAPLGDSTLIARRLGQVRRVVCASPAYLKHYGRPRKPADLRAHNCLLNVGSNAGDWRFQAGAKEARLRVSGNFVSNSSDALIEVACQGVGLVRVLSYQVEAMLAAKQLVEVLGKFAVTATPINAVMSPGRMTLPKVRGLVDYLAQSLDAKREPGV
ncbi:MAG TPA: LysR family transcriptional regulator [Casimicrobiaceae bacterium]|nr:LysR family transcriptional regulator [Casimicrobiaceae bacterium]